MKSAIAFVFSLATLMTATAHADGFVCKEVNGDLVAKVYNHTQASEGTRSVNILILSDASVGYGNKTIARFTAEKSRVTSSGAAYEADVDLRYADSNRGGEYIGGTRLGQIDKIRLDVQFSYATPVQAETLIPGRVSILKRNGATIQLPMQCQRYLKN